MKEVFQSWKFTPISIVTDNGSNVTLAVRELNITNTRCSAHTLQLVVKAAL